jgi:hypothetical protein
VHAFSNIGFRWSTGVLPARRRTQPRVDQSHPSRLFAGSSIVSLEILSIARPSTEHSSFSFVTVVLGIGILLYGTGSQGVGDYKFKSNHAGVINVAIVGGAAIITFCVAFGMIYFQNEIKTAFQIERKYFVLRIEPNDDGSQRQVLTS